METSFVVWVHGAIGGKNATFRNVPHFNSLLRVFVSIFATQRSYGGQFATRNISGRKRSLQRFSQTIPFSGKQTWPRKDRTTHAQTVNWKRQQRKRLEKCHSRKRNVVKDKTLKVFYSRQQSSAKGAVQLLLFRVVNIHRCRALVSLLSSSQVQIRKFRNKMTIFEGHP